MMLNQNYPFSSFKQFGMHVYPSVYVEKNVDVVELFDNFIKSKLIDDEKPAKMTFNTI